MVIAAALPSTASRLFCPLFGQLRAVCARVTQSLDSIMGVVFDRYDAAAATPLPSFTG
jgi:hypothetical protein